MLFHGLLVPSDVIYIGIITPTHHRLAMIMIEAGKNVLVEKPMAINCRLVKQLIDKAQENDVFLLEVDNDKLKKKT